MFQKIQVVSETFICMGSVTNIYLSNHDPNFMVFRLKCRAMLTLMGGNTWQRILAQHGPVCCVRCQKLELQEVGVSTPDTNVKNVTLCYVKAFGIASKSTTIVLEFQHSHHICKFNVA